MYEFKDASQMNYLTTVTYWPVDPKARKITMIQSSMDWARSTKDKDIQTTSQLTLKPEVMFKPFQE